MKNVPITLVTRGGSDTYIKHDGKIGTAGKGPLLSHDVSLTLSTLNEQKIFQPKGGDQMGEYVVRRLMPVECERLQGFPDGWTDIPYKGKEHAPDTPRYKALGNSMAVPCMHWIGKRIGECEKGHLR